VPNERKLSRLDLNMLLALDALITERSVSRAAERLGLSQPALSASLSRIRRFFDDPILVRRGNSFDLTPLAARLAEHTAIALEAARRVFDHAGDWSPEESTREFAFYGSDFAISTIGPAVSRTVADQAPGVRLRFLLHTPAIVDDAPTRLRSVDGLILPHGFIRDLPHIDLWHDDWVVVADADNEAVVRGLTLGDLAECHWIYTYQSRSAFTLVSRQLQNLGVEPHVDVVVESFVLLPEFLLGTNRLALVQSRLAQKASRMGGMRVVTPPFEAAPVLTALWWHPLYTNDPEHGWVRKIFQDTARAIDLGAPASGAHGAQVPLDSE
jgi:LysR family nod box-dependent transcriptional activator